jgi:hypothetical protein
MEILFLSQYRKYICVKFFDYRFLLTSFIDCYREINDAGLLRPIEDGLAANDELPKHNQHYKAGVKAVNFRGIGAIPFSA